MLTMTYIAYLTVLYSEDACRQKIRYCNPNILFNTNFICYTEK